MKYADYIASHAWRANLVRMREFEAANFQCRLCPNAVAEGHALEAHHRTYERVGCEVEGDLTALCRECHRGVTSMLRARRYANVSPPRIDDCSEVKQGELFDPSTGSAA